MAVGAVKDPNSLQPILGVEQQNHRVVEDIVSVRRELHAQQSPKGMIEDPAIVDAHRGDDRPPGGASFCLRQKDLAGIILEVGFRVMGKRLNNWRLWLQTGSAVLLTLTLLAPLSEPLEKALQLLAIVGMLVFLLTDPISRREFVRFLIPLVALVLLALLVPIDPKWVFFGFIGVFAASCLWDVYKLEHDAYLVKRKHPR